MQVTKKPFEHNCSSTSRVKTSMGSQAWVASKVVKALRGNPNLGAKELQERLEIEHKVTLQYETVWAGRQRAIDKIFGTWEESFEDLYRFKAEIELRSPGSVVEICTKKVHGEIYFHSFFMALKPCIDGFLNGCRPYLSVDSTHLTGKWKGQLAAITALDGHNWMFPVAFGFIESETTNNWTWFLDQLKKAIGTPPSLAICSDACKGLENAVQKVFPSCEQRECHRHLMQNFVKKFHGPVFGHMWPAARAYREDKFNYHMGIILEACPEVSNYLQRHHKFLWMRCRFSNDIKCDYINNNLAECFNSWIKGLKDLPVVELADKLRGKIRELFFKRRKIGERLQGHILPAIIQKLNVKTRDLNHLKVGASSHDVAEVTEVNDNHEVDRHVVDLNKHECSCGEWQSTGKPCPHALAFITTERRPNIEFFVHNFYSVAKFRAAYEGVVQPITGRSQWPKVVLDFKLLPPLNKRASGRPKKNRIQGALEKSKSSTSKKQVKCRRCGEIGHRSDGCPLNANKKR